MYSFTTAKGAPPHDPAKYDGDQKCPCILTRFDFARELLPQSPGGDALEAVDQPGDSNRRRVVHEKVHMVTLAVELRQFRAEVRAHVPHDLLAPP